MPCDSGRNETQGEQPTGDHQPGPCSNLRAQSLEVFPLSEPARSMTPRERLLTVLNGGMPDRVPWLEISVEEGLLKQVMDEQKVYHTDEVCAALGLDACGVTYRQRVADTDKLTLAFQRDAYYRNYRHASYFHPPLMAEMAPEGVEGRVMLKRSLLKTPADLRLFDEFLPDPDDPRRYETVQKQLASTSGHHARLVFIHVGTESAIHSMGLDTAALSVYDDPQFFSDVLWRYAEWSARMVEHVNQLDADIIVVMNDHADTHGPWFSPSVFRELILPPVREVTRRIRKPWIYHSDGNITPLIPDLLTLGMNALHPLQPDAMDLAQVKRQWGDQVVLATGLDLAHTLTRATPAEVDADIRRVISVGAPGGRFILSSVTLADYCQVENVRAAGAALQAYGHYPLTV